MHISFYLLKIAKIDYENCNFRIFRVHLRECVLNKSYRGGFGIVETVETCGASIGVRGVFDI